MEDMMFWIKIIYTNFRCQMNDTDSQHISSWTWKIQRYTATDKIEDADLIIIIHCSVREN